MKRSQILTVAVIALIAAGWLLVAHLQDRSPIPWSQPTIRVELSTFREPSPGWTEADARITNLSARVIDAADISLRTFDAQTRLLAEGGFFIEALKPGETCTQEADFPKVKLADIAMYDLVLNAVWTADQEPVTHRYALTVTGP